MDDAKIAVPLDAELVQEAVEAGIDVAAVSRHAVREAIQRRLGEMGGLERDPYLAKRREEIREEIEMHNRHMAEHGLLSDEWRRF